MIKRTYKLEMKKITRFVILFALLTSGVIMTKNVNAKCWNMHNREEKNYLVNGEMIAREQFELLISICPPNVVKEVQIWLLQQKRKNNNLYIETFTVNGVQFKMVKVQGGTFQMGTDSRTWKNQTPVHSVTLSDYYIGQTEVTQELWKAVMGNTPSYFKGDCNLPMDYVSWNDCQEFIKKLNRLTGKNFRLPTEAEWEYAARGGSKSRGYKYSGSNDADSVGWWYSGWRGIESKSYLVAQKQPNELGLYDMSGNVYEWCQDWYGKYPSYSQANPKGASMGELRVLRGGSWYFSDVHMENTWRLGRTPDCRGTSYGLRLAL